MILKVLDLFTICLLKPIECLVIKHAVDQFFLGTLELVLDRNLSLHDAAFLICHRAFLFLVDDFEPCFDLGDEAISELQLIESLLDLILKIVHLDIEAGAFYIARNIVLVAVAVIVRFLFPEVMLCRVAAAANCAAHESPQDEIMLVSSACTTVVLLANHLTAVEQLLVDQWLVLALIDQAVPMHLAVVEMIFEHVSKFA